MTYDSAVFEIDDSMTAPGSSSAVRIERDDSFRNRIAAWFAPATPSYVSFWLRALTGPSGTGPEVGITNDAGGMLFSVHLSYDQIRAVSSYAPTPQSIWHSDQWFFIEFRNLDWIHESDPRYRSYDFYVNHRFVGTGRFGSAGGIAGGVALQIGGVAENVAWIDDLVVLD